MEPGPGMQGFRPGKVVPSRDDREDRQPHRRGQAQLNPDSKFINSILSSTLLNNWFVKLTVVVVVSNDAEWS